MADRARTPNTGLRSLLDQANWSERQLAQQVNRLGTETGLKLTYQQPAVAHWLNGAQPREQVRPLILAAFERKLGRPVTHAEAGLTPPATTESDDTVEELIDLTRADMDPTRRKLVTAGIFSAALVVPLFESLTAHADEPVSPGKKTVRIGEAQVRAVRTMTDRIADILDELGAGHARPMAAAFLTNTVGPWLKAEASQQDRKDMLAAASDLVYLTGWMAMYERAHGLGQTYYVKALRLAADAEDHVTYCRTLRGMSLQASNLRHGQLALNLADSAAEAAPSAGPRLVAFLRGQQAHAEAMVGNKTAAFSRLRETETALSKADNRRDAIGGYDKTAYLFHVSHVLNETGDLPGSIKALQNSLRIQAPNERQGRVHAYAVLAQRQYEHGHLDAACASWGRFLDEYEHISSARGDEHFDTMRKRLRTHSTVRSVRELAGRAHEVATLKN
ncbi:hypothetical protein [Streptomyces sp. NBC_01465]|uniref:hypothetical protein n=1 Tax=Streptomyces sp. NBC_01465 TaxID=2903878 RepID=UPI002E31652A|nr:hypothetical protein [Streptomyces sp. NBC_01465]